LGLEGDIDEVVTVVFVLLAAVFAEAAVAIGVAFTSLCEAGFTGGSHNFDDL
jgi:hypothetical protein